MEVVSNPGTEYRVKIGFEQTFTELHLDIAGYAELGTATLGPNPATYIYTDVTDDVTEIVIERGRSRTTDPHRAGTVAIELLDQLRWYDPENTAGPFYGNLEKGRPCVVEFRKTGPTWHPLITANIEALDYRMEPGGYQVARFLCADVLSVLGRQALTADTNYIAQLSGARATAILESATVQVGTDIDAGTTQMVSRTETAGSYLLDLLQYVAAAEGGEFYAAADGTITLQQRYSNANPVTTFTLTPDLGSAQYSEITLETGAEVYPLIAVTDSNGDQQTARNGLSYLDYTAGVLTIDTGGLLLPVDALALANYELAIYGNPQTNVRTVTVPVVQAIAAHIHDLLRVDLGDAVKVERTFSVGAPVTLTEFYGVEGIEHRINRGTHTLTFRLGSKQTAGWLQLNSTTFGVLDSNALA